MQGLLDFIQQSAAPFYAVQKMVSMLESAGIQRLTEKNKCIIKGLS